MEIQNEDGKKLWHLKYYVKLVVRVKTIPFY